MKTAIILPHREGFSTRDAGAIALMVAGQQAEGDEGGADVEIWGDPLTGPSLNPRLTYRALNSPWWRIGRQSWRYRSAILNAAERHHPDRLEIHNRVVLFRQLSRQAIPLALYLHNDPWSIRGLKTVAERREIIERADYVVCVSAFLRQRFCTGIAPADCSRIAIVPNTVDLRAFRPDASKRREIVFVGRLIPEKGALPLLHALQQVLPQFPDWSARFIGAWHFGQMQARYPHEHELLRCLRPELASRIRFEWYQPYAQVTAAFNAAAIVVVPSTWEEPFGRTALEGMAAGCAVIAARRGGLPEVLGEAGLLVEPTADALSLALIRLMSDPDYCAELGARGVERARTGFEPAAIHGKISALRCAPRR